MSDFPMCSGLPPLGQLPNLKYLNLEQMNGISEINWDLCGSRRAFPRLESFILREMESCRARFFKEDQALVICVPRKFTHATTE
jgi:hypothetical protein